MATLHSFFLSSLLVGRCLATICMLVLFSRGGEATGCSAEQQLNGSLTYHLNETLKVSQNDYNWRINDSVHANDEDFNNTTIQSRGPHYVNFNKCYHNVSYKNVHTGKIIDCPYNCSIKPLPGVSVAKEETPSPSQVNNSSVAKEPGVICMFSLLLHEVESSGCLAETHSGGTTFHLHEQTSFCNEYSWRVNNTVVANDVRFDPVMVLSRSRDNITFKTCYNTVTYKNVCDGKDINCSSCTGDPHPSEISSSRKSGHRGDVDGLIFVVLICNHIFMW